MYCAELLPCVYCLPAARGAWCNTNVHVLLAVHRMYTYVQYVHVKKLPIPSETSQVLSPVLFRQSLYFPFQFTEFCYNEVSYTTNIVHIYMFIHIHVCIIACGFVFLYDYAYHIMYLLFYSVQIPGLNQATTEAVPAPQLPVPDNPTPLAPSSSSPSSAECYLSKEQTVQLWTQIQQVHAYSYVHVHMYI